MDDFQQAFICAPRIENNWKVDAFAIFKPKTSFTNIACRLEDRNTNCPDRLRFMRSRPSMDSLIPVDGLLSQVEDVLRQIRLATSAVKYFEGLHGEISEDDKFVHTILGRDIGQSGLIFANSPFIRLLRRDLVPMGKIISLPTLNFSRSEIDKFLSDHCQKLDESRYICTLSSKMFMSEEYVFKHINRKYPEKLLKIKENVVI
ncbi:uncharacterized protein LOC118761230 [Octopus sinensis]|uniref:Uncharacterized protein LOC118761230 n=1 Tax=Octopus sinensis TaxID=2607531 RepID=A0A7E6EHU1_9MOLL|nr:uncharacterized protein LOC118761230 [Octopus sinensis]